MVGITRKHELCEYKGLRRLNFVSFDPTKSNDLVCGMTNEGVSYEKTATGTDVADDRDCCEG